MRSLDEARASTIQVRLQRTEDVFARDMRALFEEPSKARERLESLAQRDGSEVALRTLTGSPDELGRIRTTLNREPKLIEEAAEAAGISGRELLHVREEWIGRAVAGLRSVGFIAIDTEQSASRSHASRASDDVRGLSGQLKVYPRLPDLQALIARGLIRLLPHELRRLKASLTAPHLAIVAKIRSVMRDAVLGRDDEHRG